MAQKDLLKPYDGQAVRSQWIKKWTLEPYVGQAGGGGVDTGTRCKPRDGLQKQSRSAAAFGVRGWSSAGFASCSTRASPGNSRGHPCALARWLLRRSWRGADAFAGAAGQARNGDHCNSRALWPVGAHGAERSRIPWVGVGSVSASRRKLKTRGTRSRAAHPTPPSLGSGGGSFQRIPLGPSWVHLMATRTIFGPPAAERVPRFAISHVSPNSWASAQGFDAGQVLVDVVHTAADQMSFALLATRLGRRPCRVVAVDPDAWGESSDEQSASEEEGRRRRRRWRRRDTRRRR